MATQLYHQNAILMAKTETNYGVDSAPTAASNAYLVRNLDISPMEGGAVDLEYVRPFYGQDASLRTSTYVTVNFDTDWIPGTGSAGTASPFDTLFKACGLSSTQTAAAITGTCQAGSTSSTIKLAASASATDNLYRGATVTITAGTGVGQSAIIATYGGSNKTAWISGTWTTTPDATSQYSIGANMAYDPVSSGFGSATIYFNVGGVQHAILGARGTFTVNLEANQIPSLKFTFTGLYGGVSDQVIAAPTYSGFGAPVAVNTVNTQGWLHGKPFIGGSQGIQLQKISFDLGNQINYRLMVGSESVVMSDRKPKGSVTIEMTSVAFMDWFTRVKNGTTGGAIIQNGIVSGSIVTAVFPKTQLENPKYEESDGIVMLTADWRAIWTSGNDEVRYLEK